MTAQNREDGAYLSPPITPPGAGSPDRRAALTDAAISVVAEQGLRGLTHRAVDAAARLPQGSTSNHFRTRAALVEAVAERIEARELAVAGDAFAPTGDLDDLLTRVARFALTLVLDHPDLVRVRLALFVGWPERFRPGYRRYQAVARQALAATGVADSEQAAVAVVDQLDGMMLHAVTVRAGEVRDVGEVAGALRRLVGPARRDPGAEPAPR